MSKYMDTKTGSLEESILGIWQEAAKKQQSETNKNDKSDDGEGMDKVQPKAVKKKFADRKDKDIDNDGDTDSSDEFLHKKRKAISKAISKDEGNAFGKALKDAKEKGDKTFVVAGKKYNVTAKHKPGHKGPIPEAYKPVKSNHYDVKIQGVKKKDVNAILKYIKVDGGNYDIEDIDADQVTGGGMSSTSDGDIFIQGDDAGKLGMEIAKKFRGVKVMGENFEVGTKSRRDHTLNTTPGQSPEEFDQQVNVMQSKNNYMREALAKMWGMKEGNNPFKDKKEEKKPKVEKTITGKKATEVKVDPDLEETKELDKMKKETKLKGKNLQAACGGGAAPSAGMTGS